MTDRLAPWRGLLTGLRWGTLSIGVAITAIPPVARGEAVVACVLGAYTLYRTFRPIRDTDAGVRSLLPVLASIGLATIAVAATGYWRSPFAYFLVNAIVTAGLARGFAFAARTAATVTLAVTVPFHLDGGAASASQSLQWGAELALVAVVAGHARRLFGQEQARADKAQDDVARLARANDLLVELHRMAVDLPVGLDGLEMIVPALDRLRAAIDADRAAVLLSPDAADAPWRVAGASGLVLPARLDAPPACGQALSTQTAVIGPAAAPLGGAHGETAYMPVTGRDRARGVLVAHKENGAFGRDDVELLAEISHQVGLALENAHTFSQLRTLGAEAERMRIARDLHDSVAQSLVYVSFELERIGHASGEDGVSSALASLRDDVRGVVTELRDTLHDLRTDVSPSADLVAVMESFLARVRERRGLQVTFTHHAEGRPPLRQERELWRIAQEAVTNAARHSGAAAVSVHWECDAERAILEVVDDGHGFADDGDTATFGISGMRERADAIGADLDLESTSTGTRVRCGLTLTPAVGV